MNCRHDLRVTETGNGIPFKCAAAPTPEPYLVCMCSVRATLALYLRRHLLSCFRYVALNCYVPASDPVFPFGRRGRRAGML